jgi:hypothetical protein
LLAIDRLEQRRRGIVRAVLAHVDEFFERHVVEPGRVELLALWIGEMSSVLAVPPGAGPGVPRAPGPERVSTPPSQASPWRSELVRLGLHHGERPVEPADRRAEVVHAHRESDRDHSAHAIVARGVPQGAPRAEGSFRGTGASEGEHDEGRGEVDDVGAAAPWLRGSQSLGSNAVPPRSRPVSFTRAAPEAEPIAAARTGGTRTSGPLVQGPKQENPAAAPCWLS